MEKFNYQWREVTTNENGLRTGNSFFFVGFIFDISGYSRRWDGDYENYIMNK